MARGPHDPASSRPRARLWFSVAVVLLAVGLGVVGLVDVSRMLRADTPVEGVTQGRPGCVNAAVFTGPVTVYYAADDPSVTSAGRSWWWSGLGGLLALALAGFAARNLTLGVAYLRRSRAPRRAR